MWLNLKFTYYPETSYFKGRETDAQGGKGPTHSPVPEESLSALAGPSAQGDLAKEPHQPPVFSLEGGILCSPSLPLTCGITTWSLAGLQS